MASYCPGICPIRANHVRSIPCHEHCRAKMENDPGQHVWWRRTKSAQVRIQNSRVRTGKQSVYGFVFLFPLRETHSNMHFRIQHIENVGGKMGRAHGVTCKKIWKKTLTLRVQIRKKIHFCFFVGNRSDMLWTCWKWHFEKEKRFDSRRAVTSNPSVEPQKQWLILL